MYRKAASASTAKGRAATDSATLGDERGVGDPGRALGPWRPRAPLALGGAGCGAGRAFRRHWKNAASYRGSKGGPVRPEARRSC
jgi:hypothetical protein